jgi:hypothetical protein
MKVIRALIFVFILFACTKNDGAYMSVGTITGSDPTMCACCGGWFIDIDSVSYRIVSIPDEFVMQMNTATFPMEVFLDWKRETSGCPQTFNRITVSRIKKR